MTGLLVLGALIAVGTVWFLLRSVASTVNEGASEDYHQLRLVRERLLAQLNELDMQSADEGIDAQVASDERRRLQAELAEVLRALEGLEAAPAGESANGNTRPVPWPLIVALGVAVPLIAAILFVGNNQATLVALMSTGGQRVEQAAQVPPMVLEMVARLEKRLAEQPDDAVGWARLGRSYQVLQRPADSRKAYATAYKLAPDNVEILSQYAALLYEGDPQNTQGEVFELFSRLHKLQPTHPGALWFLGLAAFQKGEFRTAAILWGQLKALLPADSPIAAQLTHAITEAQGRLQQQ
ncbi:MAG: hypothetical protein ACE5NW_04895 [Acidiferrobacterales bacterium]